MTRIKIIAITFVSVVFLTTALYIFSNKVFSQSYLDIENELRQRDVTRIHSAVKNYQTNLNIKLLDWSAWDDTYEFIQDRNKEYIESNLSDGTLVNLEVDFIAFFDLQGELVFSTGVDLSTGEQVPSEPVMENITSSLRLKGTQETSGVSEIIEVHDKILFIEMLPITKTDGVGEPVGTMLFARFFDDAIIEHFKNLTQLNLALVRTVSSNVLDSSFAPLVEKNIITSYIPLTSEGGEVLGIIEMKTMRHIYLQGKNTVFLFSVISGCAILLFGIIVLIFLELMLLQRFSRLSTEVRKISINNLADTHVHVQGNDEIGTLAKNVNDLLHEVSRAQQDEVKARALEKEVTKKLEKSLKETQEMNKLMVGRELKMVELKKKLSEVEPQA